MDFITFGHSKASCFPHGCINRTGNSIGGGAPFIPMKVAQWHMKPKKFDFFHIAPTSVGPIEQVH